MAGGAAAAGGGFRGNPDMSTLLREIDRMVLAEDRIPEIDLWPDCPICFKSLQNEDGTEWSCDVCEVVWDRYGEKGQYIGATPNPVSGEDDLGSAL